MDTPTESSSAHRAWSVLFEDRYGVGSARRLMAMLEQPCVTFARIAAEFGVTRECVRQWHQRVLPGAPSGHRRQQLCREYQMKRQLLQDPLFLGFYRRIRSSVPGQRVTLIRSRAGFRKRTVRIGEHTVLLRRARRSRSRSHEWGHSVYTLATGEMGVDFVYYEISSDEYLLVPRTLLSARSTTFVDTRASAYRPFKNTLAALDPYAAGPSPEDVQPREAIRRSV